jgi:addiction module RelE/StbE family toxin
MNLVWTRSAREDRREIFEFIDADSSSAACQMDSLFSEKATLLTSFPEIGRPGRVSGTREFLAHRHYFLIYRIRENAVQILRVLRTSRQWPQIPSASQ